MTASRVAPNMIFVSWVLHPSDTWSIDATMMNALPAPKSDSGLLGLDGIFLDLRPPSADENNCFGGDLPQ